MGIHISERNIVYDLGNQKVEVAIGDTIYFNDVVLYNQVMNSLNQNDSLSKKSLANKLVFFAKENENPSIIVDEGDMLEAVSFTENVDSLIKKQIFGMVNN